MSTPAAPNPPSDQEGCQSRSLYTPSLEHDACGIGFVAHLKGQGSHRIVRDALTMLENMEHRGAVGCDPNTGDGAGILVQIPDAFYREVCAPLGIDLPAAGSYGVGMGFFPAEAGLRAQVQALLEAWITRIGLRLLGYRSLPVTPEAAELGRDARSVEPAIMQVFVAPAAPMEQDLLERRLFILRKTVAHQVERELPAVGDSFYFTSFSSRTIVYKGQLRTHQVRTYFPDLEDPRLHSALALVHSRFSTNTFPRWRLAQPFRYIAHNGEINTIRGNINWMRAKESLMASPLFTPEELSWLMPICDGRYSDSHNLDSIVELLVMSGRSLPHVMMMLVPEAWENDPAMDPARRAFYAYHATLMEPWDGPASLCFTDGRIVGATLDRNGLRPSRYAITEDDRLVMASEAGALPLRAEEVRERGRLQPGRIFVADLEAGRIISDEELKAHIAGQQPYAEWLEAHQLHLHTLPHVPAPRPDWRLSLRQRQRLFGMTREEQRQVLGPMGKDGKEALGSMGADTPLAILSQQNQHFSHYFKQLFAQVSNPPIDPIRERSVMSLHTWVGGAKNVLMETPGHCKSIALPRPILTDEELARIRFIQHPDYRPCTLSMVYTPDQDLKTGLEALCAEAAAKIQAGYNVLILSDKDADAAHIPIPALLATGAVHHHLIRCDLRSQTALMVETGDAREVHHIATIIGYGAVAVNPYLAFASLRELCESDPTFAGVSPTRAQKHYLQALEKGLLKVMSKMGISTIQSYHGAQIYEILGLSDEIVAPCFTGSISRIGGLTFAGVDREVRERHQAAFAPEPAAGDLLPVGGVYQWRRNGEAHLLNPKTIHLLQKSTRLGDYQLYREYAQAIDEQMKQPITLRSLFEFAAKRPIPLSEVEPVANILKRFATGAMSFGSISYEAHRTLAIAMNRIGGKSNSGEGGEDPARYPRRPDGDWERSAVKQVASGRFGVTSLYLSEAEELQIKMAQGAKPGEGGQLPGHKVDAWIGRVRHATPGVGLISPPPHHDIYSIEDLAQLIFDLKNANRFARISVKLVAEAGVGTIAAGVAKAHADHILISGHDGGTGASPLSSIRHAGLPWELGLAEAHQTLIKNGLRGRVTLQVDGQVRTGRDLAIATLLGAEEWGIATAALVVEGCIMMRKCHLNTCPVGIATQNPELRQLFSGEPEHLVHFFTFLAEDLRQHMAELGYRTVAEMVGQAQHLQVRSDLTHWKLHDLDLSPILHQEPLAPGLRPYKSEPQDHGLEHLLDWKLVESARPALDLGLPVYQEFPISSINRATGTLLSHELTRRYQAAGLPEDTIHFKFEGSAGQSFAAFAAKGIRFELHGEANDYLGKGLSGARVIVRPDLDAPYEPGKNIIIGNVALYGATSGDAYIRGMAGERFAVRNSGARAVVEGVGDHGCEYMTGGVVVVLGQTGRNFAAGMSGGVAFVYDPDQAFPVRCNQEMVDLDPLSFEDKTLLGEMLERHYAFTGSRIALKLITDWESAYRHFVKVMPREYKRALVQADPVAWQKRKTG